MTEAAWPSDHDVDQVISRAKKRGVVIDVDARGRALALAIVSPLPDDEGLPPRWSVAHALYWAQGATCPVCGGSIQGHRGGLSIDHVVPRWRGGWNVGNRVRVHKACNNRKGGRMPTGCELIWLAAVNARLCALQKTRPPASTLTPNQQRRERRKRARARAQEAFSQGPPPPIHPGT